MLVELRIRDYAVVEDLTLELGPGLNVLTGETGAGKSIVVGALSLLLGERASAAVVRGGADRAAVEAVFDLEGRPDLTALVESLGFRLEDGLLILRREVAAQGRNRAWVGGSPATASVVGELGSALVDLHGQHEHQTLLRPVDQRRILDAFAGALPLATEVQHRYERAQELLRDIEDREQRLREVESRADFLRFQLDEIDGARLSPGEDEALEAEAGRLEHSEELSIGAADIFETLYEADGSISERLARLQRLIQRMSDFDAELGPEVDRLAEALHLVEEVGRRMGDYSGEVDHDPLRLEEVRSRLDRISRLKRKYGPELADVLATAQAVRAELADLEDGDHDLARRRADLAREEGDLRDAAGTLSRMRSEAASNLGPRVQEILPRLGMEGAAFEVAVRPQQGVSAGGAESIEFLVAPNRGFTATSMARIASGGELSRVMLALKSILAAVDAVPVLVFDEIDAGIGGRVGHAVAERLSQVANGHQVLVVTHLAQVAARADRHLVVEKSEHGGVTSSSVHSLDEAMRVEEVARMLGGDPESQASQDHARELLAVRSRPR